jgi:cell filamentation protein
MPGHPEEQKVGIQSVMNHVQNCLNAGETVDFGHSQKR